MATEDPVATIITEQKKPPKIKWFRTLQLTGSRSTFEFPSRVNLSHPSLYCTQQYVQD
jgi:hypothetical protein